MLSSFRITTVVVTPNGSLQDFLLLEDRVRVRYTSSSSSALLLLQGVSFICLRIHYYRCFWFLRRRRLVANRSEGAIRRVLAKRRTSDFEHIGGGVHATKRFDNATPSAFCVFRAFVTPKGRALNEQGPTAMSGRQVFGGRVNTK